MFKDITLGQYYQTDSLLHRLDPRVKIVGTLVYIISLFVVNSFIGYAVCAVFLIAMIKLSNVPVGYIVRGMKAILILLLITMAFNLFLTPGEELFRIAFLKITKQGLWALLKTHIRRIFKVAALEGNEVLILGAFGCGTFRNPPDVVADVFR